MARKFISWQKKLRNVYISTGFFAPVCLNMIQKITQVICQVCPKLQMQKSSTRNMSCFVLLYITFAFRQFEPLQKWSNHPVISRILLSVIRCLQTWRTRGCHIYLTLFAGIYICCVRYFHNLVELLGTLAFMNPYFPISLLSSLSTRSSLSSSSSL